MPVGGGVEMLGAGVKAPLRATHPIELSAQAYGLVPAEAGDGEA